MRWLLIYTAVLFPSALFADGYLSALEAEGKCHVLRLLLNDNKGLGELQRLARLVEIALSQVRQQAYLLSFQGTNAHHNERVLPGSGLPDEIVTKMLLRSSDYFRLQEMLEDVEFILSRIETYRQSVGATSQKPAGELNGMIRVGPAGAEDYILVGGGRNMDIFSMISEALPKVLANSKTPAFLRKVLSEYLEAKREAGDEGEHPSSVLDLVVFIDIHYFQGEYVVKGLRARYSVGNRSTEAIEFFNETVVPED